MSENSNSYIFDDDQPIIMPIAVLPGYVLFPGSLAMVDLTQQNEAHLTEALTTGKLAFVTSMDSSLSGSIISESPEKTGTVVRVMSIGKSERDKNIKAARIKGLYRAELLRYFTRKGPNVKEDVFYAEVKKCKETNDLSEKESISYKLLIMNALAEYGKKVSPLYGGFLKVCIATEDIGNLCDFVAGNIKLLPDMAQEILEICDVRERADALVEVLRDSIEIKELEDEIEGKLQDRLEKHQREYQLREKMAIIAEELGDGDNMAAEAQKYRKAIEASGMPRECAEKLFTECDRLVKMSSVAADAAVIRGHLDACLALPWNISTKDKTSVSAAAKKLDKDHYGLEKVKQRILEQLCVYTLTGNTNAQILCLAGPPGVGKTSVARSVAEAMGRKFARISLGGVKDEAEIRGHRRTYIGSMPGRIIAAITQAGSNNPVILLDEVDKMGYDYKGDPSTALLEV
ncbi:MAG: AAA family ATPase, partial [Clostridia bacterium]|nr:AAA family ATPase [Clostridia bacterium]